MKKFSNYFNLQLPKTGFEFFDLNIEGDTRKFVDPFQVSLLHQPIARQMTKNIYGFMANLIYLLRNDQLSQAYSLCEYFNETKGTGLSFSKCQMKVKVQERNALANL